MKGIRIYKGTITTKEQEDLKTLYKGIPLFKSSIVDKQGKTHDVVFRPIFNELYNRIQNIVDESRGRNGIVPQRDIDNLIFDECLLWPTIELEEKDKLEVQVVPTFSKVVQERSGFTEIDVNGNWIGPNTTTIPIKDFNYWGDYSLEKIEEVKNSTPFQLWRVRMGDWIFVLRPLTMQDVRIAQTQADSSMVIAKSTVMWPDTVDIDWNTIPAGIVDTLSNVATKISSWDIESVEIQEI